MKQLLIRLDDITPDMNWENFEIVRGIFEKYHIKPVIGVVPENRDKTLSVHPVRADFWNVIRQLQGNGWVIAQHGCYHVYETKKSGILGINPFSEFAGLPYGKQYEKLAKGQEILHKEGICAKMFMAPGHTYDGNTLKALKSLGFTAVTDGYSSIPYRWRGLTFLPCTLSRAKVPKGVDTLCLHINAMTGQELEELDRFFAEHREILSGVKSCMGLAVKKSLSICLEERKNLWLRRLKRFLAENRIMQQYFTRTDDPSSSVKKKKRILGLPGLLFRLLFHLNYRES